MVVMLLNHVISHLIYQRKYYVLVKESTQLLLLLLKEHPKHFFKTDKLEAMAFHAQFPTGQILWMKRE